MSNKISHSYIINSVDELIVLGQFSKVYGVLGWIRIFSLTDKPDDIFNYQPWLIECPSGYYKFFYESWCCRNKKVIVKIKTIDNRNAAFFFVNRKIFINVNQLPFLKDGEYYWRQLIGCKVKLINGVYVGKVINLIETGSNDVLVIQSVDNFFCKFKEVLIPFIEKEVIREVNIIDRVINVDWNFDD